MLLLLKQQFIIASVLVESVIYTLNPVFFLTSSLSRASVLMMVSKRTEMGTKVFHWRGKIQIRVHIMNEKVNVLRSSHLQLNLRSLRTVRYILQTLIVIQEENYSI